MKNCTVIDLFCGAGALTHGFVLDDFDMLAELDASKSCKYAYGTNNPDAIFIGKRLRTWKPLSLNGSTWMGNIPNLTTFRRGEVYGILWIN